MLSDYDWEGDCWKGAAEIRDHCWEKFPDQRMGHPRYYHDLGDRKLIYRVYGWIANDRAISKAVNAIKESISCLAKRYPGRPLFWRRQPEVSIEGERVKVSVRVAIDHPDFYEPSKEKIPGEKCDHESYPEVAG